MKSKIKLPESPIILHQNTAEIEAFNLRAKETQERIQLIINEFGFMGIPAPSLEDIKRMQKQPDKAEQYVREEIAGTAPVLVGGLKLSQSKLQEMVEIPDLHNLEFALKQAAGLDLSLISYDAETGTVEVNREVLTENEKRNTTYAETDAEKEGYLIAENIREQLQYLNDKYGLRLISDGHSILRHYTGIDVPIALNISLFKSSLKKFAE